MTNIGASLLAGTRSRPPARICGSRCVIPCKPVLHATGDLPPPRPTSSMQGASLKPDAEVGHPQVSQSLCRVGRVRARGLHRHSCSTHPTAQSSTDQQRHLQGSRDRPDRLQQEGPQHCRECDDPLPARTRVPQWEHCATPTPPTRAQLHWCRDTCLSTPKNFLKRGNTSAEGASARRGSRASHLHWPAAPAATTMS